MHPSMYDDSSGSGRLRCSQRVLSAKDNLKKMRALQFSVSPSNYHYDEDQVDGPTNSSTESTVGFWWKQRRKKIPAGPQFQADIPEWIEENYEGDSKWLGTRIWPLDKRGKKRTLIDRGPIGKGRQDTCGCKSRGSYDCVKFHLSEKRRKLKIDLGSAYYQWKFDSMGEEVSLSWSREEERKFQDIVKSNPLSEEKSFWNEIFEFFPNKSRESLVSYYFNVFLLRRRANQNRTNASNVDSDDDESEYGPRFACFGRDAKLSIFRSPRKSTSGSERYDPILELYNFVGQCMEFQGYRFFCFLASSASPRRFCHNHVYECWFLCFQVLELVKYPKLWRNKLQGTECLYSKRFLLSLMYTCCCSF